MDLFADHRDQYPGDCACSVIYLVLRRTPHLTEKDSVVIAEFSNSTGDPIFDEALRQGLAVQLEQSPFLQIVSDERVHHVLQLMGKAPNERFGAAAAREVCERIGATALLEGSIASSGPAICAWTESDPLRHRRLAGCGAGNCQGQRTSSGCSKPDGEPSPTQGRGIVDHQANA